jgi:CRISPR-associated exonuclease Cas4
MDRGSWWPDGDASAGRIPLSALEHADYCLRQAALIHIDGVFTDDARTVSGTLAHQKVHEMKNPAARSAAATQILTGVPVWSNRLGIYGICDAIEVSPGTALPVEHKIGPYVPGGPADVQAAAQALCLNEMLGIDVPAACVFSYADRRRHLVQVSPALTTRVEELTIAVRTALSTSRLPEAVHNSRCRRCSVRNDCLPNLLSAVAAAPDPFTVPSAETPDD